VVCEMMRHRTDMRGFKARIALETGGLSPRLGELVEMLGRPLWAA